MHNTYTPTSFTRKKRFLRGLIIDNQAWFVSRDIARLLSVQYPDSFHHRFVKPARFHTQTLCATLKDNTTKHRQTKNETKN